MARPDGARPPLDAGIVGAAIVLPAVFGALAGYVVIDWLGRVRPASLPTC